MSMRMSQQYPSPSGQRRGAAERPLDYSRYLSDGTEWTQIAAGLVLFFAALAGWRHVALRLTPDTPREWWLMQGAWLAVCLAVLLTIDLLARVRWGWTHLRVGLVLGLFGVLGFWAVRLGIWAAWHWQSASAP
jgi:hypothetical protein